MLHLGPDTFQSLPMGNLILEPIKSRIRIGLLIVIFVLVVGDRHYIRTSIVSNQSEESVIGDIGPLQDSGSRGSENRDCAISGVRAMGSQSGICWQYQLLVVFGPVSVLHH